MLGLPVNNGRLEHCRVANITVSCGGPPGVRSSEKNGYELLKQFKSLIRPSFDRREFGSSTWRSFFGVRRL